MGFLMGIIGDGTIFNMVDAVNHELRICDEGDWCDVIIYSSILDCDNHGKKF